MPVMTAMRLVGPDMSEPAAAGGLPVTIPGMSPRDATIGGELQRQAGVTLNYAAEDRRTAGFVARDEHCAQLISMRWHRCAIWEWEVPHMRPEGSTSRSIQGAHTYSSAGELS
jgi:hypothetical protein